MGLIKKVVLRYTFASGALPKTARKWILGMAYRLTKEMRRPRGAP